MNYTRKKLFNIKKEGYKLGTNIYDERNTVNELTGSEWKFATKTVIFKPYPVNMQHKLRSEHGGQKPPELCADIIKIFTKTGNVVLDPFMGVGGTLLGASLVNREAIGIDITSRWIDIYKEVNRLENLKEQRTILGDSQEKLDEIQNESVDFILTDVPYWNIDALSQTRNKKKARQSKLNNFENDTKNQTKEEWLQEMYDILYKASRKLKTGKYMAIFIGDMYRDKEYHFLSAELAMKIKEDAEDLKMKSNIVWADNSKSLHVFGYPRAYVPSLMHQNILIFRKEI